MWSFTKSDGNTTEPVKFSAPVKKTLVKVTPLMVAVPLLNPIFNTFAEKPPPTFRIDPGAHGDGVQVANVKFPGSPPELA